MFGRFLPPRQAPSRCARGRPPHALILVERLLSSWDSADPRVTMESRTRALPLRSLLSEADPGRDSDTSWQEAGDGERNSGGLPGGDDVKIEFSVVSECIVS